MWIVTPATQAPQQGMPQVGGGITFSSLKELKQFMKGLDSKKDDKKKEEEEKKKKEGDKKGTDWKAVFQSMFWLTLLFPFVGPAYYFAVLGSWELLRMGMSAMLK
jgi:hypothetical protein